MHSCMTAATGCTSCVVRRGGGGQKLSPCHALTLTVNSCMMASTGFCTSWVAGSKGGGGAGWGGEELSPMSYTDPDCVNSCMTVATRCTSWAVGICSLYTLLYCSATFRARRHNTLKAYRYSSSSGSQVYCVTCGLQSDSACS